MGLVRVKRDGGVQLLLHDRLVFHVYRQAHVQPVHGILEAGIRGGNDAPAAVFPVFPDAVVAQQLVIQLLFKAGKGYGPGAAVLRLGNVAQNMHHAFRHGIDAFGGGLKTEPLDTGVLDSLPQQFRFFLGQVFGNDDALLGNRPVFFHRVDDVLHAHVRQERGNHFGGVFQVRLHVFFHHLRLIKLFQLFSGHIYPFRSVFRLFQQDFRQIMFLAAVLFAGGLAQNLATEAGNELFLFLIRCSFLPERGMDGLGIGQSPADGLGVVQMIAVRNQLGTLHVAGEDFLIGIHDAAALGQKNLPFNNAAAGNAARFSGGNQLKIDQRQHQPDDRRARQAAQDEASSGKSGLRDRDHERLNAVNGPPQRCGRRFRKKCILRLKAR